MKTVMITGAGRGLGKCLADTFGQHGYNLVLHCGREDGDLKDYSTILKLAELAEIKSLDLLINNAGVYVNKPLLDTSCNEFREVIETNLLASIFLTRAIWPVFQEKKSGTVIFINSVAGKCGSSGELAYCASKFGLKGFADSLQFDGIRDNVRVISVFLGAMKTDMTKNKREDSNCNIDPYEVALIILDLCKNYKGAKATEITINKTGKRND